MAEKYKGPYDMKSLGLEIGPRRAGGGYGKAFSPLRDTSGQSQQLNRRGVSKQPVQKLGSKWDEFKGQLGSESERLDMARKYFTPKGEPPRTRMQERAEQRRSDYEATQQQGIEERNRRRAERKERFGIKFERGGMVHGQCRDYKK